MKNFKTLIGASTLAMMVFAATPALSQDDKVFARIDGVEITQADIDTARSEIGAELANIPEADRERILIEFLLENQLLAGAAEADKLADTPGFENRLKYYKRRAMRDLYFELKVRQAVKEADARKIYDDQVSQLKPETEMRARHILVKTEAEARDIVELLARGQEFATVAKEKSTGPSNVQGGDLGYFTKGQMVPEFEKVALKLKKGEVSEPVKTQFGWHVIKLEDKREKKAPAFDDVKDRILAALIQQKNQEVVQGLRAKAKVEIVDPDIRKAMEKAPRGSFN